MTFAEIVQRTMDRLNLSDDPARTRIGEEVNERYGWLATSMGLQTLAQDVATADTVVDSEFLTFGPIPMKVVKINNIFNQDWPRPNLLGEISLPEMRQMVPGTGDPAQLYAIYQVRSDRVTVMLDSTPATVYTLSADVIIDVSTLSGADVPRFPAGFHNLLYYGAMASEYDKMENNEKAQQFEGKFEQRCSELRMFLAKSEFKDIYQGKTAAGPVFVNRLV